MNEQQADAIANALGGEAWQSGGGIWVVTIHRGDGRQVVISEDAVCQYADDEAFDAGRADSTILLQTGINDDAMWVVQDAEGTVYFRDRAMGVGWKWREEADIEALAIYSRTGVQCFVRELQPDDLVK